VLSDGLVAPENVRVRARLTRRLGNLTCRPALDGQVMAGRPFAAPWDIEDNGVCFIVRDNNGQALLYVYYETEPGRRTA